MTVRLAVERNAWQQELRNYLARELPGMRSQFVAERAGEVLQRISMLTPVETGRARRGWEEAGEQLQRGGATVVNSEAAEGTAERRETGTTSEVELTNGVPYIVYLEYGTRRMQPMAMVRQALSGG